MMICRQRGNVRVCVEGNRVEVENVVTKGKKVWVVPSEISRMFNKVDFYYFLLLLLMWCDC